MAETWTYNDAHTTDKDKVRAIIPDKTLNAANKMLLSDQQINLQLSLSNNNVILTAAECCGIIAAELSKTAESKSIGTGTGISVSIPQAPKFFADRAKALREKAESSDSAYIHYGDLSYGKDQYGNDIGEYWGDDV